MPAYIVGLTTVHDPSAMREYVERVPATLERFDGIVLLRGPVVDVLSGDLSPDRIVVLQFGSLADLRSWHASEEYRDLIARMAPPTTSWLFVVADDRLPPP